MLRQIVSVACLLSIWAFSLEPLAAAASDEAVQGADEPAKQTAGASEGERLFVLQVHPLLSEKCLACHGKDPDAVEAGLVLTDRQSALRGGDSGEVVLKPGDAAASALYTVLLDQHDSLPPMPPKENDRLTEAQAWAIRNWIDADAPWPAAERLEQLQQQLAEADRSGERVITSGGMSEQWTERRYEPRDLWAYRPLQKVTPPTAADPASPVDAFIDAALHEAELPAAPPADRATLARRAAFDLTGLPPDPHELRRYLSDPRPNALAFSRYADRLLASPHHGEQAARHWLDVSRYADSSGFANDYERPNAWRYRDYVVRSMNNDRPYDQFVRQQIAGDEIDAGNPENLIAVGFLRMGPWEQTGMSVAKVTRQQFLDDVTDMVGQVFLGHALQCARCHDHKFDPVPTRDYYRIQAVFATTQFATREAPFLPTESTAGFQPQQQYLQQRIERYERVLGQIDAKHQAAARRWYAERDLPYAPRGAKLKAGTAEDEIVPKTYGLDPADNGMERIARKYITRHRWELDRYRPLAFSVYAGGTPELRNVAGPLKMPADPVGKHAVQLVSILTGGDPFSPTEPVTPGVLSALSGPGGSADSDPQRIPASYQGRRLAFAHWLTDPANPLPARVMANRIWQQHFGRGIAFNANNFGTTGAKPTHPQLLDWLAVELQQHGWSIKRLRRQLLHSAAYQRSSRHRQPDLMQQIDPLGQLWACFVPRRLAAEELRDAMLVASGSLNRQIGGIPVRPDMNLEAALQPRMIMGTYAPAYQSDPLPSQRNRRTIYALRLRGLVDPALEVFNQPGPDASCERRSTSTVTPQALTLINGRQSLQRAVAMADDLKRLVGDPAPDPLVRQAFRRAYGRDPSRDELHLVSDHYRAMLGRYRQLTFEPAPLPTEVRRRAVDELTGEAFEFTERLEQHEHYVPEATLSDVDAATRALADVCLVLINSNEFLYVE